MVPSQARDALEVRKSVTGTVKYKSWLCYFSASKKNNVFIETEIKAK